jgi:hypothetical protein
MFAASWIGQLLMGYEPPTGDVFDRPLFLLLVEVNELATSSPAMPAQCKMAETFCSTLVLGTSIHLSRYLTVGTIQLD